MRLGPILLVAAAFALLATSCGGGGGSGEWNDASDTGFADPRYDAWFKQEGQLVGTDALSAHSEGWTGFPATLWGFCKCFYTSPKPTS